MKRLFRLKSEQIGDRRVAVHRVTCHECAFTATVTSSHGGNPLPPEAVARHFRTKGWQIGDREKEDRCPYCVLIEKTARRAKRLKLVEAKGNNVKPEDALPTAAEAVEANKEETVAQPMTQPEQETTERPAVMGREDRRITFAAINDAYLDAERGYKPGWSDKRVAESLGIPLSWVLDLREEMFGPAGDSAEVRLLLEQIQALREEAERDLDKTASIIADATRRVDELAQRLNMLSAQATRLTEAL